MAIRYKEGKYFITKHDNGDKVWQLNGIFHREEGPAIIFDSKSKSVNGESWYLGDIYLSVLYRETI